jgi:hypothetical protein
LQEDYIVKWDNKNKISRFLKFNILKKIQL